MTSKRRKGSKGLKKLMLIMVVGGLLSVVFASGAYASTLYTSWGGTSDYNALVATLSSIGIKGKTLKEDLRLSKIEEGNLTLSEAELKAQLIQAGIDKAAELTSLNISKAESLAALEISKAESLAALEISKAEALAILESEKAALVASNAELTAELSATKTASTETNAELTQAEIDMADANAEAASILSDLNL